jgi:hypothetical protein
MAAASPHNASNLPVEVTELLATGGVTIYLATRAATLQPDCVMAYAVRPEPSGEVTVFLAENAAQRTLENVRDNRQMAMAITRPSTNGSVQLKGEFAGVGVAGEDERRFLEEVRARFADEMEHVGIPRAYTLARPWWPTVALRMRVRDVFLQTPGPEAGRRLAGGGDSGGSGA